jgi:hypothetical protein
MRSIFLPLGLVAIIALASPPATQVADLSGTWNGRFILSSTGHSLDNLVITLNQSGQEVRGTLLIPKWRSPMPLSGTYAGGKLRLVSPPTLGLAVTMTARVRDPNRVIGTALLDYSAPNLAVKQDKTRLEMTR